MKILIVDDHVVVREGLASLLAADGAYEVVGTAANGDEACNVAIRTAPDVVLLDLRLADARGTDVCRAVRSAVPGAAIVMFTSYANDGAVRASMEAGANGYVTKDAGIGALKEVIEKAAAGDPWTTLVPDRRTESTTDVSRQDRELLELASRGLSDGEIARTLHLAESTVRYHMQKLKRRLEASSKTALVAQAIRRGLISLDD